MRAVCGNQPVSIADFVAKVAEDSVSVLNSRGWAMAVSLATMVALSFVLSLAGLLTAPLASQLA